MIVYLCYADPSLTKDNVTAVVATVEYERDILRDVLFVPRTIRNEMERQGTPLAQKRERFIEYFLKYSHLASWNDLGSSLCYFELHEALAAARKFIRRTTSK